VRPTQRNRDHSETAKRIETQIVAGDIAGALRMLHDWRAASADDPEALGILTLLFTRLGRYAPAFDASARHRKLEPGRFEVRYAFANAAIAVGRFSDAEEEFDALLATSPEQAELYYTRSTLRKQTADRNHIAELQRASARFTAPDSAVPIAYALGKEFEDLERFPESFDAYASGAGKRRARLSYDVSIDTDAMRDLAMRFGSDWWRQTKPGAEGTGSVFVFGLPRSGTTLVERILGSHPDVASLGENNDFTYAVMRAGAGATDKKSLMNNVAAADMSTIGAEYGTACRGYGEDAALLINKTPANYLYLGLIAKALPDAKLVHVRRHPVASAFAMYKSLFRMGYPFSYSFDDLADYRIGYERLMKHWQSLFGDRVLTVPYEALVDDAETWSRRIVDHCGLEWSDACLEFHKNAAPTMTASAAQVRSPIYRSAKALWRQHDDKLAPLVRRFADAGLDR
jgi:tetratricopeptide (TPR) repeat protein